jgi:hypothetical protein
MHDLTLLDLAFVSLAWTGLMIGLAVLLWAVATWRD